MKTKVNILDYFAYSNYCWYQYLIKKSRKYCILAPSVIDNATDSASWMGVSFFFIGLKILSQKYNGIHNLGPILYLFILIVFILSICLYVYYNKNKKEILKLMKRKSRIKVIISHTCTILFFIYSLYSLFSIK